MYHTEYSPVSHATLNHDDIVTSLGERNEMRVNWRFAVGALGQVTCKVEYCWQLRFVKV